jgi:membrane-bound metal-dependent hydrolase YbcI (DUF457 family)
VDNIAHGLTGALIGYCGFRQRGGRAALWACVAAAEFPDSDIVLAPWGHETFLHWHRTFTHSVAVLPFWAVLLAWAFWEISGRRDFRLLFLACATGIASHIAMDWATSYGTVLFWPLSNHRFALSWVFIVDVYVWGLSGIGLLVVLLSRPDRRASRAKTGLAVVGAYFLMCGVSHVYALHTAVQPGPGGRIEAYPQPLYPFRWTVLRRDGDEIHWINGSEDATFADFHDDVLLPKAEATPAVKLFRWFAGFPLVQKVDVGGVPVLRYSDLRFRTPMPWGGAVRGRSFAAVEVVFDGNGHVVSSHWGARRW